MLTRFTQRGRILLQSQSLWHETASFYWGKFCLRLGSLHTGPCVHQWLNGSFHSSRLPNWGHCWADFMHEFMMPLFASREHLRLFPVCPFWAVLDNEHIFLDLEEKLAKYFPKEWKQDSGKVSINTVLHHYHYIKKYQKLQCWDSTYSITASLYHVLHVPCGHQGGYSMIVKINTSMLVGMWEWLHNERVASVT